MKITIIGRQMNVENNLKALVEKKLAKFDKFFSDEAEAFVTFSRKRNKENLEVTISAAGTLFRCEEEDETFQNALDRSVDTIERQIRKNKTRLAKRLKSGAFDNIEDDIPEEETEFKIRTKTFDFKPMSVEEAILQMQLLGHKFFVFKDAETEDTCVVYERKDGAFGLIVPEK